MLSFSKPDNEVPQNLPFGYVNGSFYMHIKLFKVFCERFVKFETLILPVPSKKEVNPRL